MKRGGSLRRLTPLRRIKRLNPVSAKRAAIADERRELVARILSERPRCEVCRCCVPRDLHEPLARSRGGSPLDESNAVAVCRGPGSCNCHDRIHDNPDWATSRGLLQHSWEPR